MYLDSLPIPVLPGGTISVVLKELFFYLKSQGWSSKCQIISNSYTSTAKLMGSASERGLKWQPVAMNIMWDPHCSKMNIDASGQKQ